MIQEKGTGIYLYNKRASLGGRTVTYEKQHKEIQTIRGRSFVLNLSDADVERLYRKSGMAGMTPEELLGSFVGDLVRGTYSNGSDERESANRWFERCGFEYTTENSFLRYLLSIWEEDSVIELWQDLQEMKVDIQEDLLDDDVRDELQQEILKKELGLQEYWTEYQKSSRSPTDSSLEEAMKKVMEWKEHMDGHLVR